MLGEVEQQVAEGWLERPQMRRERGVLRQKILKGGGNRPPLRPLVQHERQDGRQRQAVLFFMPGPDFGHVAQQPQGHGGLHGGLMLEEQVEQQGICTGRNAEQQV